MTSPLAGARVLVPRAADQAEELSSRIREAGGDPIEAPVLVIEEGDSEQLLAQVRSWADGQFRLVCLTSPNGVRAVAAALVQAGIEPGSLSGRADIGVVGPGTARALADHTGLEPDFVPEVATTEALARAVPDGGGAVLLARAELASPILPRILIEKGYQPVEVVAYRAVCPDRLPAGVREQVADGAVDFIAVLSPSTARNLVSLLGGDIHRAQIISIGPVTTAACERLGLSVANEANPHTLDGLLDALEAAAAADRPQ